MSQPNAYRPIWVLLFVVTGVAAVVGIARMRSIGSGAGTDAGLIPWQSDYAAASDASAKSGKPMLVYITADWCGYCRKLDGEVWSNQRVATAVNDRFIPVKIDGDKQPDIGRQFNAQGYPWVVSVTPGKPPVAIAEGYMPAADMLEALSIRR